MANGEDARIETLPKEHKPDPATLGVAMPQSQRL